MMCMKYYVQKLLWREHLCALQVFLCMLVVSRPVCARAQLRGNIAYKIDTMQCKLLVQVISLNFMLHYYRVQMCTVSMYGDT